MLGRDLRSTRPPVLSTVERVLFLRSADIFSALGTEDLVAVGLAAEERTFQAGAALVRQGAVGDSLYLIVDGEVRVVLRDVGQIAVIGPNGVVGELGVLSGRPRTADCVAAVDTLALRLARDDFRALIEERPRLALGVIDVLTRRLDDRTVHLTHLQVQPPRPSENAGLG